MKLKNINTTGLTNATNQGTGEPGSPAAGSYQTILKNYLHMKRIIIYLIPLIFLASCDFMAPLPIQDQTTEDLWSHSTYGEGILTNAYSRLASSYPVNMDYYTDNAVPSTPGTNLIALGSWTVENSPIGDWDNSYNSIKYLNLYIDHGEDLVYSVSDPTKDSILRANRMGEAYFLRAWYEWQLLQAYAGVPEGGSEVLGFPIVTEVLEQGDDLDIPRNTYEDCVQQIVDDCDAAIAILPLMYDQGNDSYQGLGNRGRGSGLAAMALKARVYLHAASPAYGSSSPALWERAAEAAAEAIEAAGGLTELDEYGNFNDAASFDNIWIQPTYTGRGLEVSHYPPSLYGSGSCNPSQNLVDEFPAFDGYPVDESPFYDPAAPYENRDDRFYRFIFHNGEEYNNTVIETFTGGDDAPGGISQRGTRTGYYMKKLLSKSVRLAPPNPNTDIKFYVYLGKTELYLNFAEAANEAYGPVDASLGFSAEDALGMIRMRAGIDSDTTTVDYDDQYMMEQSAAGKAAFGELIQTTRRVELCFEGFRFWDMRRLNSPLNHTVRGVRITREGDADAYTYSYNYVDVENHTFPEYARYAPLPYAQTLIMNNLQQNQGW
jgi:starch-binding outer membrane protein, SusD/RagB family